jgi:hypothetical protein
MVYGDLSHHLLAERREYFQPFCWDGPPSLEASVFKLQKPGAFSTITFKPLKPAQPAKLQLFRFNEAAMRYWC